MTKKCFACIKSSQEVMGDIKHRIDAVISDPSKAYRTLSDIGVIVDKWINDFGDVDPSWSSEDRVGNQ